MKGYWRWPRYWATPRIAFVPADFWIGVFYKSEHPGRVSCQHDVWMTIVPMFPLHVRYWHKGPDA